MQREVPEVARGAAGAAGEGGLLLRLLQDEPCEGWEKSFKLAPGMLLDRRLLLGIPRARSRPDALIGACEGLSMPPRFLAAFVDGLAEADTVHFGYEDGGYADGGPGLLYKVYLEYARRLMQPGQAPVLLHLAFKWDPRNPARGTVARYTCHRSLPSAEVLERVAVMYGGASGTARETVSGVVRLAAGLASEPLMYLEVAEDGNPRASFDINLHPAALRLRDIEAQLRALQAYYGIPADAFDRLLAAARGEKLAHLSGGMSREGRDFVTVYHEAAAP